MGTRTYKIIFSYKKNVPLQLKQETRRKETNEEIAIKFG
jgi:hypothetical protein